MLKVAFAGTPQFAVPSLQALIDAGHTMVGVLCQPDRPAGRGRELKPGPVKQLALRAGIPVSQPATLKTEDERAVLREWAPDVLVVAAYGLILPPAALAIPRLGCINVHASLLPRWRGAAPIQRAILAGDAHTGVCIMRMAAGLDTGPVFGPVGRRCLPVNDSVSGGELQAQLATLGASALIDTLVHVEAGTETLEVQSPAGVTYASKISKTEARIDWQAPSSQIARQVRAFNPWPVAQTPWEGQILRVWEASSADPMEDVASPAGVPPGQILSLHGERLLVQCGDGPLALTRVQLPGRRVVSAREFAGQRSLAGARFE
ncbi:MAG TPA: methionyl-tRNA formyltransferase [Steroidobacteraceae bacterium]|jgi:methionyl-tRNA formyltransferase|nr:methionyl-tRNA formyltransferase [Steroidobacteraceae bacterium]